MNSGSGSPIPSSVTPAVKRYCWKSLSSNDEGVVASVVPVVLKNSYPNYSKSSAESDLNVLNNTLISELECL